MVGFNTCVFSMQFHYMFLYTYMYSWMIVLCVVWVCTLYVCREWGGREAEQDERQRWNERERNKIMDSVKGNLIYAFSLVYM